MKIDLGPLTEPAEMKEIRAEANNIANNLRRAEMLLQKAANSSRDVVKALTMENKISEEQGGKGPHSPEIIKVFEALETQANAWMNNAADTPKRL